MHSQTLATLRGLWIEWRDALEHCFQGAMADAETYTKPTGQRQALFLYWYLRLFSDCLDSHTSGMGQLACRNCIVGASRLIDHPTYSFIVSPTSPFSAVLKRTLEQLAALWQGGIASSPSTVQSVVLGYPSYLARNYVRYDTPALGSFAAGPKRPVT